MAAGRPQQALGLLQGKALLVHRPPPLVQQLVPVGQDIVIRLEQLDKGFPQQGIRASGGNDNPQPALPQAAQGLLGGKGNRMGPVVVQGPIHIKDHRTDTAVHTPSHPFSFNAKKHLLSAPKTRSKGGFFIIAKQHIDFNYELF